MKKIDKYLLFSFLPPFVVTFFIALFVLIMQFLWVYIDDIIGKGVGVFLIIELIFYLSISLFPMALPIAVLISTVMVTGNLAEHYELSSFKSAGVPLLRVMRPLMVACGLVAVFSFFCANNLIPIANLKFKSRLYDIRKQKPTLSLDGGVFNYDFQGSVIHIGKKRNDERTIEQVKIYDHENSTQGVSSQITAQTGEMYTTGDDRYFVMNLYGGTQYQEPTRDSKNKERKPFIRTSFKEFNKVYDLSEFQLSRTNEELFKQHETMLSIPQLAASIDSIDIKTRERKDNLVHQFNRHFLPWKTPEVEEEEDRQAEKQAQKQTEFMDKYKDKLPPRDIKVKAPAADSSKVMAKPIKKTNIRPTLDTQVPEGAIAAREKANSEKSKQTKRSPIKRKKPANQISLDRLDTLSSFTQTINTHQRKG
ncbi:MAG: LptF/LptG family permease, partial [Bacteroidota bacterium]